MEDFYDDFDDDDFDSEEFESDEFDPEEADRWKECNGDAKPNMDDHPGIDWHDFTLGAGLGYEMGYGERRRKRRDDSI